MPMNIEEANKILFGLINRATKQIEDTGRTFLEGQEAMAIGYLQATVDIQHAQLLNKNVALAFYADPMHWDSIDGLGVKTPVNSDRGAEARRALGREE